MTFYEVLGVEVTASTEEIEHAFRLVARRYHPDLNRGLDADERMKEINRIRATLIDPHLRAEYDQRLGIQIRVETRSAWGSGSTFAGAGETRVSGARPMSRSMLGRLLSGDT
jgi:curved DNA-binding protein